MFRTASAATFGSSAASSAVPSYRDFHPPMSAQEFPSTTTPKPKEQYAEYKPGAPLCSTSAAASAAASKTSSPRQSTAYDTSPPLLSAAYHSQFPNKEPEPPPQPSRALLSFTSSCCSILRRGLTTNASKDSYGLPDQNKVRTWSETCI
jgi:hypothetical protein